MTVQGTEWGTRIKNKNKKKHDITYPCNFDEAIENSVQKRVSQIHKHIEVRRFHSGIEVCLRHFVHDKNNLQQQFKSRVQQQQIGTDPNRSCSIWSIMSEQAKQSKAKQSKQAKRGILMQKPSYLQAQQTDGSGLLVAKKKKKKKKTQRTNDNLLDANCELEWAASEKSFLHVRECHAGRTKGYSIWIDTYCSTRGT